MRLHTFVNMYLSPLQHGLQTAHLVQEMNNEYSEKMYIGTNFKNMLEFWAKANKTIIIHNGGCSSNLLECHKIFSKSQYPHGMFHEDTDSLNGALTVVGIIVPQHVEDYATLIKNKNTLVGADQTDLAIASIIASHSLA